MPTLTTKGSIAIFGGTFDPVHQAHLACARYVLDHCAVDEVQLMPCHLPAHRSTPGVSAEHRATMVQLAIQHHSGLTLQSLELNKHSPSYSVESLRLLKAQYPAQRLLFVMGMDSLAYFRQWHQWQQILELAHLIVCQRPGSSPSQGDCPGLIQQYGATSIKQLQHQDSGLILPLNNPPFDLSATRIRQLLEQPSTDAELESLLSPEVLHYIKANQLYVNAAD